MNTSSFIKNELLKDPIIKGMLYFFAVILITHVLWKLLITGNEHGHEIAFMGKDVSPFFYQISLFIAKISGWVANNLLGQHFVVDGVRIYLNEQHHYVTIIWACTGIKQCYMFICLILFFPGISWLKRIIFATGGCIVLEIFNIIRIDIVNIGTKINPNNFDKFHDTTQFLPYVVMFLLWIYWMNKVLKTKASNCEKN